MAPKKKQEKMALGDFLTNQSLGSWADEMDSVPVPAAPSGYGGARDREPPSERRAFTQPNWGEARTGSGVGGGMSMGGRGSSFDRPRFEREAVPFPTKPPYTAHLGNLAYDVSSADVESFLSDCQVTTVRIMEDKVDRKPKGFGYVEFATPEGLRQALSKTESNFMGRNVKISVADPPKDRPESNRDFSDWSRKGPLPDLPQNTRQPSNRGFNRGGGFDNMSDAGSERGGPPGRKPGFFENDGKVRDFSNWERKGPLSPVPGSGPPVRDGGRLREGGPPGDERRASPAWGEGRSDAGSRPPRKEFEPRPERAPTAAEQDSQWRARMKPDPSPAATPDVSTPTSPAQEAPKERPRLNLAKRTVSTADPDSASASSDSKASPFGAARPIDTATREREVEEKRELAIRQKKEADDKTKEEKAAKDASAREARAERADRGQAQQEGEKVTSPTGERAERGNRRPSRQQNGSKGQAKENGEGQQQSRASFSILQREEGEEGVDMDTPDAPANGTIIDDKETKPQEPVVPVDAAKNPEDTAQAMEDEGWSTVAAKPKNNRRAGGRAIAS
ncbi:RNA-binding sce3 [Lecanosticta acicola]|uniref:RNA-binding sce3 n=1 Tax=Lecanosticta acicola TaxID=111012 RepID=A0AAI8YS96_9PEZI|nr:RNA-binding sce3 [Lecanosticta acicola]